MPGSAGRSRCIFIFNATLLLRLGGQWSKEEEAAEQRKRREEQSDAPKATCAGLLALPGGRDYRTAMRPGKATRRAVDSNSLAPKQGDGAVGRVAHVEGFNIRAGGSQKQS